MSFLFLGLAVVIFFLSLSNTYKEVSHVRRNTTDFVEDYFCDTLVHLTAALIRIDKTNQAWKVNYLKRYLRDSHNYLITGYKLTFFSDKYTAPINVKYICQQYAYQHHSDRLVLLYQLYRIATIDNDFDINEDRFLAYVGRELGISNNNVKKINHYELKARSIKTAG